MEIKAATELIVVSSNVYVYKKGNEKKCLRKREADAIFKGWKDAGKQVHRKYGMGGNTCWVWVE